MSEEYHFSKRENEVAKLLLQGKSNKQIALLLGISEHTVEFHLKNIYEKLGVSSRTEAILILGKTPGWKAGVQLGDSAVAGEHEIADNESGPVLSEYGMPSRLGMKAQAPAKYSGWLKILIPFGIVLIGVLVYMITRPTPWQSYERECEYPDEATVGEMIWRSNASGAKVLGQFGTTADAPWPA